MKSLKQTWTRRTCRNLAFALPTLMLLLSAMPTDSVADSAHHGRGHAYGHRQPAHVRMNPGWAVPRRIYVDNRGTYQPYFYGRAYYGPHRHYHTTYQFPVYLNGSVVYRPYSYCGDQIFINASVPLPRLAFNVTFGAPLGVYGPNPFPFGGYISYQHTTFDDDHD